VSFSVPILENQIINFLTLKSGSSVNNDFPEFQAQFNSAINIDLSTVKVRLNGIAQPASDNLEISEAGISGTFSDAVRDGLNTLEVELLDTTGSLRKKSQYFFKISLNGSSQYISDAKTAGLWHFEN